MKKNKFYHFIKPITWLTASITGWGNGYVCIPKSSKLYGVDYTNIDVDVHGGLTLSCESEEIQNWEELPKQCKKNYWIVGFDCAHYGDTQANRPKEWVEQHTKELLNQLKAK